MQNLATGVGDLKRVLTNEDQGWGEIQLAALRACWPRNSCRNVRSAKSAAKVEFALSCGSGMARSLASH
jgi:DNA anti-recombination protein RmuC